MGKIHCLLCVAFLIVTVGSEAGDGDFAEPDTVFPRFVGPGYANGVGELAVINEGGTESLIARGFFRIGEASSEIVRLREGIPEFIRGTDGFYPGSEYDIRDMVVVSGSLHVLAETDGGSGAAGVILKWDGADWAEVAIPQQWSDYSIWKLEAYRGDLIAVVDREDGQGTKFIATWDQSGAHVLINEITRDDHGGNTVRDVSVSGDKLYMLGDMETISGIEVDWIAMYQDDVITSVPWPYPDQCGLTATDMMFDEDDLVVSGKFDYAYCHSSEGSYAALILGPDGWREVYNNGFAPQHVTGAFKYAGELYLSGKFRRYDANQGDYEHYGKLQVADGVLEAEGLARFQINPDTLHSQFINKPVVYEGSLYVPGYFGAVDGVASSNLIEWNGSEWRPVRVAGTAGVNGAVYALDMDKNTIAILGAISAISPGQYGDIAIFSRKASRWIDSSPPAFMVNGEPFQVKGRINGVVTIHDGSIYFNTSLHPIGDSSSYIPALIRYSGGLWENIHDSTSFGPSEMVSPPCFFQDDLYTISGDQDYRAFRKFDDGQWVDQMESSDQYQALSSLHCTEDNLYLAGDIQEIDGVEVSNLARWDGVEWHAVPAATADPCSSTLHVVHVSDTHGYASGFRIHGDTCQDVEKGIFEWELGNPEAEFTRIDGGILDFGTAYDREYLESRNSMVFSGYMFYQDKLFPALEFDLDDHTWAPFGADPDAPCTPDRVLDVADWDGEIAMAIEGSSCVNDIETWGLVRWGASQGDRIFEEGFEQSRP